MSKLVSVETVRKRMNANDVVSVLDLIDSVLEATTLHLQSILRLESFASVTGAVEVFFLEARCRDVLEAH